VLPPPPPPLAAGPAAEPPLPAVGPEVGAINPAARSFFFCFIRLFWNLHDFGEHICFVDDQW